MKSVLVTGCSSGIGRCIAELLRKNNFRVITTARNESDLQDLKQAGFDAVLMDLSNSDSIKTTFTEVMQLTDNKIYGLVNNAAYGLTGAMEDLSRASLREQFETNVFGTQELTNLIIPVMRKHNEGRIIQISSVLGFVTMKFRGAYCASKYALEAFSDAMSYELTGSGIHVSLIEPGPIYSRFRENALKKHLAHIDRASSHFQKDYEKIEYELHSENYKVPFSLSADAVAVKVLHALTSYSPGRRYFVTFPTYLFAFLKRILPGFVMDPILKKI